MKGKLEYRDGKTHSDRKFDGGRKCHVFRCRGKGCKYEVARFQDTSDRNSTGRLRRHVNICFPEGALAKKEGGDDSNDEKQGEARGEGRSGRIDMTFRRTGKGKVTFTMREHTKAETR